MSNAKLSAPSWNVTATPTLQINCAADSESPGNCHRLHGSVYCWGQAAA